MAVQPMQDDHKMVGRRIRLHSLSDHLLLNCRMPFPRRCDASEPAKVQWEQRGWELGTFPCMPDIWFHNTLCQHWTVHSACAERYLFGVHRPTRLVSQRQQSGLVNSPLQNLPPCAMSVTDIARSAHSR
eukprot:667352-Rhodomonas_salina.2